MWYWCWLSCERQEVAKLPVVPEALLASEDVIVVGDSKEGWAKAYAKLLSALYAGDIPKIDYFKLRLQVQGLRHLVVEPVVLNHYKSYLNLLLINLSIH